MEPLSALSLATSVVQFVDFSSKLISGSIEIYKSTSGQLEQHNDLKAVTKSLSRLTAKLEKSDFATIEQSSTNTEEIVNLCKDCRQTAKELTDILLKLKLQKATKRESVVVALKSIWGREKLEDLQHRLDGYRQQLVLLILVALREDLQSQHERKFDHLRSDLLEAVRKSHQHDTIAGSPLEPRKEVFLQPYSNVTQESLLRKVLLSLRFREISDRLERIPIRHQETYEWIFRESERNVPWDSFVDWLKGSSSIYWLTGKSGSGKSTLMKFLLSDPRTCDVAHSSTDFGSCRVIIGGFCFWNSGTVIQMSQNSLIQTLLHDCLKECPESLPFVLPPHRLEELHIFGIIPDTTWIWPELARAFLKLLERSSARFYFFVDGLDEYSGHLTALIDLLQSIAAFPNVKLCVSSRPWPIFEDAFAGQASSLRLQDLTYPDMLKYVSDKVTGSRGFSDFAKVEPEYTSSLVENLVKKASGVFLWVTVVVASLLTGLSNGGQIEDLQAILDALPPDLEGLFHRILGNIEPSHRSNAARLFQLVNAARRPLTLLQLFYADKYDLESTLKLATKESSPQSMEEEATWMKRRP
ncbi:uncharacterized protein BDZ99DRAFT_552523 [Mytilinidion resinicola]|uniref:Nephrocystin 3-like N-terminal domain-containing protein n=1 Tax=Mytilinidion resinicola TaxID=574789 RepID=A0A6A6XZ89_9PEZI|nr:uncharacterized protein BDZ99DRAFT_552523 [Mytilinidion resinicola]KAF2801832.1 hypothetical protein BDZ99DRAFT_552523 [Mytilinidion resinicola]